jgi:hypothetical protein
MVDFEIRKGVPLPGDARRKYRFDKMEVGDSFEFPRRLGTSIRGAASTWSRRYSPDTKFEIHHTSGTTSAIWRVK